MENKYPNFNDKFKSKIISLSKDEDDGNEFPLNYYSSEDDDENISYLLPIPTLTTDAYKMVQWTNDEVAVNVMINSVATYDDSTITNDQYLTPSSSSTGVSIEEV